MKVDHNFDLYQYNTMRLHCVVDRVIRPVTVDELVDYISTTKDDYVVLAGGSNVILPPKLHRTVVLLHDMVDEMEVSGPVVRCCASLRIQTLIRNLQKLGLGGLEYLFSVPCTIGGAVYMNAGRGEIYHQSVADHVLNVECFNLVTNQIESLNQEECLFGYRHSVFHDKQRIILKVSLRMDCMTADEIEQRIADRLRHSQEYLDASKPSSGSIFLRSNPKIMCRLKGLRIGGACWSKKTDNWISNDRSAKYWHVIMLIRVAQIIHKVNKSTCQREVIILKK